MTAPHRELTPEPTLLALGARLPSGPCLDLACGAGRHGLWAAQRGEPVEGWDRDAGALEEFARRAAAHAVHDRVQMRVLDLEHPDFQPPRTGFQSVLVFRYLWRPLAPVIASLLAPGGALLYETFTDDPRGASAPRNPEFRLQRGELPGLFPTLRVHLYREHIDARGHALAVLLATRAP